jgi:hypothetical protein
VGHVRSTGESGGFRKNRPVIVAKKETINRCIRQSTGAQKNGRPKDARPVNREVVLRQSRKTAASAISAWQKNLKIVC